MHFAKFISKRFVTSMIRQLARAKAKSCAESNEQLVNIIGGSVKDKDINLEPDEQSRNSKLVFPNPLNIMLIFTYFLENHFFISRQEVQPMNKLSLRWCGTKYNKF